MKTSIALLIKFAVTFLIAWVSFSVFDNVILSFILIIAVSASVLNYLIGDLIILPRFGNAVASVMDGVIAAVPAYIIFLTADYNEISSILIFATMVAIFEVYFHMYLFKSNMIRTKSTKNGLSGKPKLNYSTEIAKEMNPDGYWKFNNYKRK